MWSWLRPNHKERRRNHRLRFEVERDKRIQAELETGKQERLKRERILMSELRRLDKALRRHEALDSH